MKIEKKLDTKYLNKIKLNSLTIEKKAEKIEATVSLKWRHCVQLYYKLIREYTNTNT